MNPLFDRQAHERVEAALRHGAPSWRRAPSADLRERIESSIEAGPTRVRSDDVRRPSRVRRAWIAASAALVIGWLAWQAAQPAPPRDERRIVLVSAGELVQTARNELTAPSIARSLDRPLVAEVGRMRADARRAVDFLVARVTLPVGTRARGD